MMAKRHPDAGLWWIAAAAVAVAYALLFAYLAGLL